MPGKIAIRYGENTLWLFAERAVQMGLAFAVGILIARMLGPESFGMLNYAITFDLFWAFLVILGIDQIAICEILNRPGDENLILGSSAALRTIGFFVMAAAVVVSSLCIAMEPAVRQMIWIILFGYLGTIMNVVDFHFQAHVRVKYTSRAVIAGSLLITAANLWGWRHGCGLLYFAVLNGAMMLTISTFKCLIYGFGFGSFSSWRCSAAEMMSLMRKSAWILWQSALVCVSANIGCLLLKSICSDADVGYYSVAAKILACLIVVPDVICLSFFPAIVKTSTDPLRFRRCMLCLYAVLFWAPAAAVAVSFFLGKPVIVMLYGDPYELPGRLLWLGLLGYPFQSISYAFAKWCVVERLQRTIFVFAAGGAVGSTLGVWILTSAFGLHGALTALCAAPIAGWLACFICGGSEVRTHLRLILTAVMRPWEAIP